MVAKQIRRELSDMLLKDKVLQYAVLPEASLGADRYLSSLTTISDVEVSADLQVSLLVEIFMPSVPLAFVERGSFRTIYPSLSRPFGYLREKVDNFSTLRNKQRFTSCFDWIVSHVLTLDILFADFRT